MHSLDHPEKSLKLSIKTQRLEVKPFNAPQLYGVATISFEKYPDGEKNPDGGFTEKLLF